TRHVRSPSWRTRRSLCVYAPPWRMWCSGDPRNRRTVNPFRPSIAVKTIAKHGANASARAERLLDECEQLARRIDVLTSITGVSFEEAWATKVLVEVSGRRLFFLGRDALVTDKRATGTRAKAGAAPLRRPPHSGQ